jgi:hypothetical protein
MRFVIGGRELELTQSMVISAMNDQEQELIRECFVELPGGWFPPKQVLAAVTSWDRGSFTTHEAIRVLTRLGLACRRMDEVHSNVQPSQKISAESREESVDDRLSDISSSVKVLQAALAGLSDRVRALEVIQ